jgi:hypothetical protein
MTISTGVNASKLVGFGLLAPNTGVDVSKIVSYALLENIGIGVDTSKLVAYALLVSTTTSTLNSGFAGPTSSGGGNIPFV